MQATGRGSQHTSEGGLRTQQTRLLNQEIDRLYLQEHLQPVVIGAFSLLRSDSANFAGQTGNAGCGELDLSVTNKPEVAGKSRL